MIILKPILLQRKNTNYNVRKNDESDFSTNSPDKIKNRIEYNDKSDVSAKLS